MVESIKERAVGETRTTTLKSLASYSTVRKLLHRVLTTVVKEKRGGKVGRLSKKKPFNSFARVCQMHPGIQHEDANT